MPDSEDEASAVGVAATIARITKGLTSEQQSFMLQRQGRIYLDQDDADAAIECFSRSISLFTSVANFVSRAQAYERNLDWSEAYYDYSFAIRLEPENGLLYGCRGMCLAKLKKFNIAIEDLTKCCQVSPESRLIVIQSNDMFQLEPLSPNFYNRASICVEAGRYNDALKGSRCIVSLSLSVYYSCVTKRTVAPDINTRLLREDAEVTPDLKARCVYLRALIYVELKAYDAAFKDLSGLLISDPNACAPRALLSKVLRLKGVRIAQA